MHIVDFASDVPDDQHEANDLNDDDDYDDILDADLGGDGEGMDTVFRICMLLKVALPVLATVCTAASGGLMHHAADEVVVHPALRQLHGHM